MLSPACNLSSSIPGPPPCHLGPPFPGALCPPPVVLHTCTHLHPPPHPQAIQDPAGWGSTGLRRKVLYPGVGSPHFRAAPVSYTIAIALKRDSHVMGSTHPDDFLEISPTQKPVKEKTRGTLVAQLVECPALGFGSGHDTRVLRWSLALGSMLSGGICSLGSQLQDSLPLSLPLPISCTCSCTLSSM